MRAASGLLLTGIAAQGVVRQLGELDHVAGVCRPVPDSRLRRNQPSPGNLL